MIVLRAVASWLVLLLVLIDATPKSQNMPALDIVFQFLVFFYLLS